MNAGDPLDWYLEIPIVSRVYFTASFLTTAACALELVSPLTLYFNYKLIFEKGQVWRLVTNFCFFGMFSLDFVFHLYFLVRYCRLLEENSFRNRTGDFIVFILFGMVCMCLIAPFVNIPFFGSSLTFMMVYIWGRRNEHVRMSFLGLFPFNAPYLPWVLFSFSLVLGSSALVDLIGIAVGHIYFYFDDIYPAVAEIRGWNPRHYLRLSEYFPPPSADAAIRVDTAAALRVEEFAQVQEIPQEFAEFQPQIPAQDEHEQDPVIEHGVEETAPLQDLTHNDSAFDDVVAQDHGDSSQPALDGDVGLNIAERGSSNEGLRHRTALGDRDVDNEE